MSVCCGCQVTCRLQLPCQAVGKTVMHTYGAVIPLLNRLAAQANASV